MCLYVYAHMCVHSHCTLDIEVGPFPELWLYNSIFRCQAASGAFSLQSPTFQGEPQTLYNVLQLSYDVMGLVGSVHF